MRMPEIVTLLATVSACSCAHSRQTSQTPEPANGTISLGCGYLMVENHGPTHFTVLLTGHDMQQVRKGVPVFVLDGVLVEAGVTTAKQMGSPNVRGMDLLRLHMKWESDFISQSNHWPALKTQEQPTPVRVAGADVLTWTYESPASMVVLGREVIRVMYLTVALDDIVFAMTAPMRSEDDPRIAAQKLEQAARTLHRSAVPLDAFELSKQLDESPAPLNRCARWGA